MGSPNLPTPKKGETGEEQIQENDHLFLHQTDCSQSIRNGKLNSQLRIVRRLRPELWRQEDWLLHHDNAYN
jgi:hypothetical protein